MSDRNKVIHIAFCGGKWNWSNEVRRNKLLLWMMSINVIPLWFTEFGVRDSQTSVCVPKMETFSSLNDAQLERERKECNFDRRENIRLLFFLQRIRSSISISITKSIRLRTSKAILRRGEQRREAKNDWNGAATRNLFFFSFLIKCYRSQTRIELPSATQPLDSACECSVHRIRTRRK